MARPLRIEFAVGLYHLTSRGDGREDIYGLQRDWLLSAFAATEKEAVARYRRFVAGGVGQPSPWDNPKHQVFLGDETFVAAAQRKLPSDRDLSEIPRAQHCPLAKPLSEYARRIVRPKENANYRT